MAGHSKWATTHRQKAVTDAKRGAIFTKLSNLISLAAKKGGDPDSNPSLRSAIDRAREASMPKENIERAIKKGTGELSDGMVEELYYEGIGPAGVQVIVKSVTDNKNRSAASIRHIFSKNSGSLSAVKWNFDPVGAFMISQEEIDEKKIDLDSLELDLIDKGASEIVKYIEGLAIYTPLNNFQLMQDYLNSLNYKLERAEAAYLAKDRLEVEEKGSEVLEKFLAELEDNEDVSDYYTNLAD